jgi:hypothetical protein
MCHKGWAWPSIHGHCVASVVLSKDWSAGCTFKGWAWPCIHGHCVADAVSKDWSAGCTFRGWACPSNIHVHCIAEAVSKVGLECGIYKMGLAALQSYERHCLGYCPNTGSHGA